MGLAGPHQAVNGGTALAAAEMLAEEGWGITAQAVREGLRARRWPGRFEIVQQGRRSSLTGPIILTEPGPRRSFAGGPRDGLSFT